jgi:hypothetical protein
MTQLIVLSLRRDDTLTNKEEAIRRVSVSFSIQQADIQLRIQVFSIFCVARSNELVELEASLLEYRDALKRSRQEAEKFFSEKIEEAELPFLLDADEEDIVQVGRLTEVLLRFAKGQAQLDELTGAGAAALLATSFEYKETMRNSRSRTFTQIAKCAVVECARVNYYRRKIITTSSAGLLRHRIQSALKDLTDGIVEEGRRQYRWSFWDGIEVGDLKKLKRSTQKQLKQHLEEIQLDQMPSQQQKEIAAIMKLVDSSRVMTINGLMGGPFEHHLRQQYNSFVDVSYDEYGDPVLIDSTRVWYTTPVVNDFARQEIRRPCTLQMRTMNSHNQIGVSRSRRQARRTPTTLVSETSYSISEVDRSPQQLIGQR